MRVLTAAALLATLRLIPSLVRRPTWRVVARFRELQEDIFVDLVTKHFLIGYQRYFDEHRTNKGTP